MPQITDLAARVAVQTGLSPKQASSNYENIRSATNEIVGQTICHMNGILDGREGTHGRRAPTTLGGNLEIQYLRGFAEGSVERAKSLSETADPRETQANQEPLVAVTAAGAASDGSAKGTPNQVHPVTDASAVHEGGPACADPLNIGEDTSTLDAGETREVDDMVVSADNEEATEMHEVDDPFDEPIFPSAIFPPVNPPPARPARHLHPLAVPFFANALPGIRLPEGTDCFSIAGDWHPQQREELMRRGPTVAWVRSERQVSAAPAQFLAFVTELLGGCELKDQSPLSIVKPYTREDGTTPNSIAIIGTEEQIRHLTSIGTWVTPLACLQIFPNHRIPPRLVGTVGGLDIELHEFSKVSKMVKSALRDSIKVCEFLVSLGVDLEDLLSSFQLECVRIKEDGRYVHLWNILMSPPSDDVDKLNEWRGIVTSLCPRDPLVGQLRFCTRPFFCKTCGCIRHPTGLCPTISTPDWLGFIPCSYTLPAVDDHKEPRAKGGDDRARARFHDAGRFSLFTKKKAASVKNAAKYGKLRGRRVRYLQA